MFINARTDLFLGQGNEPSATVDEAVHRSKAYADAGASGFFIPGLQEEPLIALICEEAALPVNVMVMDGVPDTERLAQIGVARISYGPIPYIQAMNGVQEQAEGCEADFQHREGQDLTLFDEPRDYEQPAIDIAAFDGATVHQLDEESSITFVYKGWSRVTLNSYVNSASSRDGSSGDVGCTTAKSTNRGSPMSTATSLPLQHFWWTWPLRSASTAACRTTGSG